MDETRCDGITPAPAQQRTRRGIALLLGGLASGGGLASLLGFAGTDAKKQRNKKQRNKKKNKKKQVTICLNGRSLTVRKSVATALLSQGATIGPCQLPPPPPPPPTTGPGRCAFDGSSAGFAGNQRWAQTFFPPQSGQLTAAEIGLRRNPASFDLTVEIRSVTAEGAPSNTVLATEHVLNIGQTVLGAVVRVVRVTFAPAVPLDLGTPYALVLTGPPETTYAIHANTDGDRCPDGALFGDQEANGSFVRLGNSDLVYELITAA